MMDGQTLTIVLTSAATLIGAITTAAVTVIKALRDTRRAVDDTNTEQIRKLDNITVLVNGRYLQLLQELAEAYALIAKRSRREGDRRVAAEARQRAEDQAARVAAAAAG